ncbi:MAG: thioredoxin [Patescibacteria group bacterium]
MSEINLTDNNFEAEVLKSTVPVLIDFFAVWCGPCQMLGPIVDELAKELADKQVKIAKLDVDQAPQTAEKYGVMSVPTLIIFNQGKEIERMIGVQSKEALREKLEKIVK